MRRSVVKTTDGMAYFSLMAELEALEKAAAARGARYNEKFGASDEVFYAKMRLALQTIRPASNCTSSLRESEGEPASNMHVTRLPSPEPRRPQPRSRRSSIESASDHLPSVRESEQEESAEANEPRSFEGLPRHIATVQLGASHGKAHPFRQGMLKGRRNSMSTIDLRPALRPPSEMSFSTSSRSMRSGSHVSFETSTDFNSSQSRLSIRTHSASSAGSTKALDEALDKALDKALEKARPRSGHRRGF
ncbi:hypothetical protein T484DRAFT_1932761, partial [Baffinella frigidus]